LEQTRHVGVAKGERPRLTNGEIIFEEFQPMWSQSTNVTDRQTDGRTDRQTTCDRNTALCTKVHRAVKTCMNDSVRCLGCSVDCCREWRHCSCQSFPRSRAYIDTFKLSNKSGAKSKRFLHSTILGIYVKKYIYPHQVFIFWGIYLFTNSDNEIEARPRPNVSGRGQSFETEAEAESYAKSMRPRPGPKFWPRGHFGLENVTSLEVTPEATW